MSETSADIVVRRATREDAAVLAELAQGLNIHQGDPVGNFTDDVILRDGFGAAPCWTALLAEQDGRPAGYAMFHMSYDAPHASRGLYLQDLFVAEDARRHGVGRALMAALAREARDAGCVFFWWTAKQWNTEAIAFYRRLGAASETVVAHALFGDAFDRLIAEDAGRLSPPPARHGNDAGSDGRTAQSARRTQPRTRAR